MPGIRNLLTHADPRVEILRDADIDPDGQCVLLWVQRAQRATANHAANLAVELADELGLPVIAGFCLSPGFPSATLRAYTFMAEGLAELPEAFARRHIGWDLVVGQPPEVIPAMARRLRAALIVTDLNPLRVGRDWRRDVAEGIDIPLVQVDSDTVVPSSLFPRAEFAPRTIRPRILKRLDEFLHPIPDPSPHRHSTHRSGPDPLDEIGKDSFDLDREIPPSTILRGGAQEAHRRLGSFVRDTLPLYDVLRDRSDLDQTSHLSPYLHFGQIGPIEVVMAARDAVAGEHYQSFIDEVVVQRELSINYVLHVEDYDQYKGLPDWGRETLEAHAGDERPVIYTPEQLARGETHDPLWNAAQRQLVVEGFMNNRMRLYWGKQIPLWRPTPKAAYDTLAWLNDRFFVCGRDANSYANISWVIGGRHDRPFPADRPVTGTVRPMTDAAIKRSFRPQDYIAMVEDRYGVPGPRPEANEGPTTKQARLDI
ncbi:MAG TPA: deoxyribodipyrimidine photo-lyase [Thermomicrobiales bacterium]|jgi:deoxyribodipyrimidine photo-lyase|nr:deoxyribodipyrimidine photo-lyase [Thermomicrobiales bacterium]